MKIIKKYFATGLAILLPLTLTIIIIAFFFNLLTVPFAGLIQRVLGHYHLLEHGFLFLNSEQLQRYVSQLLVLVVLFFGTVLLGMLARRVLFNYFLHISDAILQKIPLVRTVYKTCQDVITTLFKNNKQSFKQVVLVPFPHENSLSIGFITLDACPNMTNNPEENLVAVFIPTTPNPTSGFLLLIKPEQLTYIDMKVEDAFKCIISCGTLLPTIVKKDK
jgi:uncharacterized membrane protein